MVYSQLFVVIGGATIMGLLAGAVLLVYLKGRRRRIFPRRHKDSSFSERTRGKVLMSWPSMIQAGEARWASLYARVGSRSKLAGLGFVGLTSILVVLSYFTQFVVLEIDSVVAFLAAIVLLFSEPRRRIQSRVMDAVLESNEKSIADLAAKRSELYEYLPASEGVSGVVLVPVAEWGGMHAVVGGRVDQVTPPGRALAQLFVREAGVSLNSMDTLEASLPEVMTGNFELARSIRFSRSDDTVTVILGSPAFECPCSEEGLSGKSGVTGCTVASFLAVLVCAAEGRSLALKGCARDFGRDLWRVSMTLGPKVA